ncbi:MAG: hypothetical protein WCY00_03205 [Candidatus Dojkabacteria bacterium]
MNNKKTALLVISLIFVVLSFFFLNEAYYLIPRLYIGVFNRYSKSDFGEFSPYDLSEDPYSIKILCYVEVINQGVSSISMECLNTKEALFEKVEMNLEGRDFTVKFNWEDISRSVQLISICLNNKTVKIVDQEERETLVFILEQFDVEDFILYSDLGKNEVYVDIYDYMRVKMSLIDYYSRSKKERVAEILQEMDFFFEEFFESGYIPLKPVNISDIEKLEELDPYLAMKIVSLSRGSVGHIYQDCLYRTAEETLEENISIDQSMISFLVDMYKVETSLGLYEGEDDIYSKILTLYQESFAHDFEKEKLNIIVKYFPIEGELIQDYLYHMYLEDKESFFLEVSKLTSYIYNYSVIQNKYTLSNLLQYEYND